MKSDIKVYEYILGKGGKIILDKPAFPQWPIKSIRVVSFSEPYVDKDCSFEVEKWNNYVYKIRDAIGVKSYCCWIGWPQNIVGILAAYTEEGEEIKLKHFEDEEKNWKALLKILKSQ